MFDKVSSILNISNEYKSSRKRTIKLSGKSTKKVEAFNSIVIIAHALLQNAIKYSHQENIDVELEDIEEGIEIRVTSIGPHIKIEDQDKIFQKGYRCDIAKRLHSDGMGIGLYIAQRIAQAHRVS